IVSSTCEDAELRSNADVVVFDSFAGINAYPFNREQSYVFRSTFRELFDNSGMLNAILPKVNRINIVITDVLSLTKDLEVKYAEFLDSLAQKVADEYKVNHGIQINLLTDRILLDGMNNCNAGDESITLCPDGKFYICPAFYSDSSDSFSVGNPKDGIDIKNPQLYKISHAPICRICDAFQCKRCIWLNKSATLEVNTPSHEQCVIAHIERNASRNLLSKIREIGTFLPEKDIPEIDYIDPFEKLQE
ncbi:MAG: CXXX repeat peptide maturase, partial [Muribaculaceae bacterium]|nr:CXXX repeat peptide maturase [Muribaculaceae bacterium]